VILVAVEDDGGTVECDALGSWSRGGGGAGSACLLEELQPPRRRRRAELHFPPASVRRLGTGCPPDDIRARESCSPRAVAHGLDRGRRLLFAVPLHRRLLCAKANRPGA